MIVASGSTPGAGLAPASPVLQTRSPTRADWRLVFGLSRAESVLVVGAEAWELGRALSPWVRQVYLAVDLIPPSDATRLTAIQGDPSSLPLTECSLDWIIFDGPIPGNVELRVAVARLLPTLKPGGGVVSAFTNLWGVGGLLQLRRKAPEPDGVLCHGLAHACRLLTAAGLSEVRCYAMLPGRRAPRTLIPLAPPCPPAAEKFALDQAWKRAARRRAIGRLALHLLVDLRLLRFLYPQYLVVARKPC
jgi:hypothetical protein